MSSQSQHPSARDSIILIESIRWETPSQIADGCFCVSKAIPTVINPLTLLRNLQSLTLNLPLGNMADQQVVLESYLKELWAEYALANVFLLLRLFSRYKTVGLQGLGLDEYFTGLVMVSYLLVFQSSTIRYRRS